MDNREIDRILDEYEEAKRLGAQYPFTEDSGLFEYSAENIDEDSEENEETADSDADDEAKSQKVRLELYDWVQCFVTALICGILIFVFVGRTIGVDGVSMMNTLRHNDRVIMHNVFYTPKRGDVIVFQSKSEERFHHIPLVKRVIATAGDTIDIDFTTGDVYLNGRIIDEDRYIRTVTTNSEGFVGPVTVPDGYVFVMGDNRNSSSDSRDSDVGFVDTRYILGHVVFLLVPGQTEDSPRDWSRFGPVSSQSGLYK